MDAGLLKNRVCTRGMPEECSRSRGVELVTQVLGNGTSLLVWNRAKWPKNYFRLSHGQHLRPWLSLSRYKSTKIHGLNSGKESFIKQKSRMYVYKIA